MRQITCVITHGHARPVDRPLPTLVQDILNEHIQAAERRARTRTLGRVAPAIVQAITTHRGGQAWEDGGAVPTSYEYPAWTTVLRVAWWRRGHVLYLAVTASRERARRVSYGRAGAWRIATEQNDLRGAMARACPERAQALDQVLTQRRRQLLERAGIAVPDAFAPRSIRWLSLADGQRAALVEGVVGTDGRLSVSLATPWEWRPLGTDRESSVTAQLRAAGLSLTAARRLLAGHLTLAELDAELVLGSLRATREDGLHEHDAGL